MRRTAKRESLDQRERAAASHRKWHVARPWLLTCPSCAHSGTVHTTLQKLRSANLKCSACGAYLWRK